MLTKLKAASLAARSGTTTVIASGRRENILPRLAAGEQLGTLLVPGQASVTARKRWLAGQLKVSGRLHLDAGAAQMLRDSGKSLLGVGVTRVEGDFSRGDIVACVDQQNQEVARGMVNYDAKEARKIIGRPSTDIASVLGYVDEPELVHRDNLVLTAT